MNKSRDREKKVVLACGLGVLAVVGLMVLSWDGIHAWYVGYRFIWLPEGAVPPTKPVQRINASGEVPVEISQGPEGTRAGRWSLATREVLPLDLRLASGKNLMASAINDGGEMTGTFSRSSAFWGNQQVSFLWNKDGGVREISSFGCFQTIATAINERGQVVGGVTSWNYVSRAFLWSAESGITCPASLAPGKPSEANAINEASWVVGGATAADGSSHPFLWKPETGMQDLGMLAGFSDGVATHINDQGDVLVNFYTTTAIGSRTDKNVCTPFVWRECNRFVKLPVPPGFDNVWAVAISNRGTVLLHAVPSNAWHDSIAYLIVNGVLRELPAAPGAKSTHYYGLNDKDWLVGVAQRSESASPRGFVALPLR